MAPAARRWDMNQQEAKASLERVRREVAEWFPHHPLDPS
ncbi:hypothetical protein Tmar_0338 [Thermaerobacter marianensis DSM 12885]|uniref:Uncharacterized protein n=1 Tax=Thermaerobacter marianensis (strain ATCC 700841 / DSM 12885 / JCM 10246 / 7p75a) TaxID=644966 RepID=E6SG46_THEM7|nr:hypothetical protein Tmar_0338 [Thermaerobacter marianensis DSM 12885]